MKYWQRRINEKGKEVETLTYRCDICRAEETHNWDLWTEYSCDEWRHNYCPVCSEKILAFIDAEKGEKDIERFWKARQKNALYGKFGKLSEDLRSGKIKIEVVEKKDD